MPAVTMSDDDREKLRRLAVRVINLDAEIEEARRERNEFMHWLYNNYRADVPEIATESRMERQSVHPIIRGPRTRSRSRVDEDT